MSEYYKYEYSTGEYDETEYKYGYLTVDSRCGGCGYPTYGDECLLCGRASEYNDWCHGCGAFTFIYDTDYCNSCISLETRGVDEPKRRGLSDPKSECQYCGKKFYSTKPSDTCFGCKIEPLPMFIKPATSMAKQD